MLCRAIIFVVLSGTIVRGVFGQRSAESSERNLTVHETVLSSGSSLVFSWTKCEQCDGYEAHLFLGIEPEQREVPYKLNPAVTSLKITDVPPRKNYRFVLERNPPDDFKAEVFGRSSAHQYPPPVEDLVVEPLLNSSLRVEWKSKSADGFLVRILQGSTVLRERTVMRFAANSSIRIWNLEPSTEYEVHVIAFYNAPERASSSSVRSSRTKTLPSTLPVPHVEWKIDSSLELSWTNPRFPAPTMYGLTCFDDSRIVLNVNLDKSTTSAAISREGSRLAYTNCTFRTWYGHDEEIEVSPVIWTPRKAPKWVRPRFHYHDIMRLEKEEELAICESIERVEQRALFEEMQPGAVTVKFFLDNAMVPDGMQYRLCTENAPCDNPWRSLEVLERRSIDSPLSTIHLRADDRIPWKSQIIYYRLEKRCYFVHFESKLRRGGIGSLKLPVLVGAVESPSSIAAAGSRLSWTYASTPDYFLVTSCIGKECKSLSISGDRREIDLANRGWNISAPLLVQAVRLHARQTYVSPPATITLATIKEASTNV